MLERYILYMHDYLNGKEYYTTYTNIYTCLYIIQVMLYRYTVYAHNNTYIRRHYNTYTSKQQTNYDG
eukprot:UN02098